MSFPAIDAALLRPAPPDAFERWLERWGGVFLAALSHLALLAVLWRQIVTEPPPAPPPDDLTVTFHLAPPPSPPPPPDAAGPSPAFAAAAATAPDPDETAEETEMAASAAPSADPAPALEAAAGALAVLPPEWTRRISEEMKRIEVERKQETRRQLELELEVARLEMKVKARKYHISTDGARTGAIRSLDVAGMPEDIVRQVFHQYDIRIERHVTPSSSAAGQPSFLNMARTDEGVYRSAPASGPQDVFVLTPSAIAQLSRLEREGIQERGLDPLRTRVREIHFGIIKNARNEWDLGVIFLDAEEVE